jgi:hypothetical protein
MLKKMNYTESNLWNIFGNTLSENTLNNNVLQMWSKRDCSLSRFYTTGFETILFNKEKSFVLETVLSSSASWDSEILIAGNNKAVEKLSNIANKQNLDYRCLDWFSEDWEDFVNNFTKCSNISHLLVGIDSETSIDQVPIKKLLQFTSKNKCSLIVYCDTDVTGLNDIFDGAIDYMIGDVTNEPVMSFVVARRNRLVQTEGNSSSFSNNLYLFWQLSLRNRTSFIEPMRF